MKLKKMAAVSAILLALVCAAGGYISLRDQKQNREDNQLIERQLSEVRDIKVKEGENLPDLKEAFADASMIDQTSIKVDIQNVDSAVPGTYDVVCAFNDVKGNPRKKTIICEVEPDLIRHVSGLEDLTLDCGENLPADESRYDEYVESIIRDDSMVDKNEPGTYQLTYSILGTNGEVEEVERLATVLDNKSEPAPEADDTAGDTDKPDKELDRNKQPQAQDETSVQTDDVTGNVEAPQENYHAVATGDSSKITVNIGVLAAAVMAAALALYKKGRLCK